MKYLMSCGLTVEDVKAKIYENMKIANEHVDAPTLVHGIVTE